MFCYKCDDISYFSAFKKFASHTHCYYLPILRKITYYLSAVLGIRKIFSDSDLDPVFQTDSDSDPGQIKHEQ